MIVDSPIEASKIKLERQLFLSSKTLLEDFNLESSSWDFKIEKSDESIGQKDMILLALIEIFGTKIVGGRKLLFAGQLSAQDFPQTPINYRL